MALAQTAITRYIPGHESVITDLVPLLPHPWARGSGSAQGGLLLCAAASMIPLSLSEIKPLPQKGSRLRRREAAGSQPTVQSSEPQPGLTSQVPPCGGCLLPAPCLQTTEHLPFPHPLAGRVEVYFGFLTFAFPKVSLEAGRS